MTNQEIAFEKFTHLKVGALFMKMGTGKTKVALDLVKYNNVDLLLYICPFSTKANIEQEINKWGINCEYKIIGYETIQSSNQKYLELLNQIDNKNVFLVADESIFIKNETTKRFKRVIELRKKCKYALVLNGTPIAKDEWDLYNQMYFLSPKIIDMSREQFLSTFFKRITYKRKGEREKTFYKLSEINAEALYQLIEPYIFECNLDFDKKEEIKKIIVYCDKTNYQIEKEKKLEEYMMYGDSHIIINMLASLNHISALSKEKNKKLADYIKNKKLIVFCNFLDEVEEISSQVECYTIIGNTKNKELVLNDFKNDNKPLIMTYGTGSYSLNLQFCSEIVYSSLNFDYSKYEQSKYRIKRIGQEKNIVYTYFLTNFNINNLIFENLERKSILENLVKKKIMEGGIEWLKSI